MDDDPQSTTNLPVPVADRSGANGHDDRSGLAHVWQRLRTLLGHGEGTSFRQSLEGMIEQHEHAGTGAEVTPEARSMLLNILEFSGLRVDDVMVPRADIISIDEMAPVSELLALFADANHSRLPVYRETLDEPVGMVHIKDLLSWLARSGAPSGNGKDEAEDAGKRPPEQLALGEASLSMPLKQTGLVREILFVPPSMPAADLLVKMQSTRNHMAIVVDEYGGTDGLVSIEDIVEEIVGDIADEHDEEGPMVRAAEDGVYIADARAPIEELEELLHVDLLPDEREEDVDTLGGLMFSLLGRVPVRGELVRHGGGLEFEVLEGDPRRLKKIRIHTNPPPRVAARRTQAPQSAQPARSAATQEADTGSP